MHFIYASYFCFILPHICKLWCYGYCRAGELTAAELDNLMVIVANPRQFKIPDWFLNRKKDYKDGKYSQVVSNALDMKLRDDLERLKKIRYASIDFLSSVILCLRAFIPYSNCNSLMSWITYICLWNT